MFERIYNLAVEKYPKLSKRNVQYGTAGFRSIHSELPPIVFRMGLLAVLRSKAKKATIGVMITASHNPEEDNGVKIIDPFGEMLEASWELFATYLANVEDEDIATSLNKIICDADINIKEPAQVFVAHDTRFSSPHLCAAVKMGVEILDGKLRDYGLLTTPQLHYMVCCYNTKNKYGEDTEDGYYKKLSNAFIQLRKDSSVDSKKKYLPTVKLDGANGIGSIKIKLLQKYLENFLDIKLYNDGSKGKLNYKCGADFVKVQQKLPEGLSLEVGDKGLSYDGDADRIVYYYLDSKNTFHLLDGDKIAVLVATYLKHLLNATGLTNIKLCIVQTAYANGNSTNYISNTLKIPVACVPTGVKHLHHRAQKEDIGIYFEANGHGTVLFNEAVINEINEVTKNSCDSNKQSAAKKLLLTIDMINQTTGDAISDMLLVETILYTFDWDIATWNNLYADLPNKQLKVKVVDRTVITTTDAERKCVTPNGLQKSIDELVKKYENGRSFVRPSGTEDLVRVYAEATTQENADMLAREVAEKVYELAGGI
ncbi:phosphoacetylglucosamine mutase-like [Centruroides sculpturatus]|uniref:phosphoacetylglucosamine mutase-like n=1 Tax=Centruroides sculpturatus TaxID=218467 RepID=UPI000C6E2A87|nr:phosphoacetylglucosamine mutase-like [Centruroides sculpturatus]